MNPGDFNILKSEGVTHQEIKDSNIIGISSPLTSIPISMEINHPYITLAQQTALAKTLGIKEVLPILDMLYVCSKSNESIHPNYKDGTDFQTKILNMFSGNNQMYLDKIGGKGNNSIPILDYIAKIDKTFSDKISSYFKNKKSSNKLEDGGLFENTKLNGIMKKLLSDYRNNVIPIKHNELISKDGSCMENVKAANAKSTAMEFAGEIVYIIFAYIYKLVGDGIYECFKNVSNKNKGIKNNGSNKSRKNNGSNKNVEYSGFKSFAEIDVSKLTENMSKENLNILKKCILEYLYGIMSLFWQFKIVLLNKIIH